MGTVNTEVCELIAGAELAVIVGGNSIYTLEYDGFAVFPMYPINQVSSQNAFLGISFIHGNYEP